MIELPFNDIQGIILTGYGHLSYTTYLFLQVTDRQRTQKWLSQITNEVTSAARWDKDNKPQTALNIAFSYKGLAALGLSEQSLQTFSAEFREGMTEPLRAFMMGDTGDSAPDKWDMGNTQQPELHILLMLFAVDAVRLAEYSADHRQRLIEGGLIEVAAQDAIRPRDNHEHFGFYDGISQPNLEGDTYTTNGQSDGQPFVKSGEFIFGYPNEYGLQPPRPEPSALGVNGSYLVYRKLTQDVGAFRQFLQQHTDGSPDQMTWLAAKMVGRWPSGAPLTLTPEADDPLLGADPIRANNFTFAETDRNGYGCPVGSHIRRANPRDSLETDPTASLLTTNRHRIIRRGRSYGPEYSAETADEPRGVAFIAINADLKRQFEFIQEAWMNDPRFNGLYDNPDPLLGLRDPRYASNMAIQRSPIRKEVHDMPTFVTMRGGGYFFLPGLRGIKYLAELPMPAGTSLNPVIN